jgi:hypothetical protein
MQMVTLSRKGIQHLGSNLAVFKTNHQEDISIYVGYCVDRSRRQILVLNLLHIH